MKDVCDTLGIALGGGQMLVLVAAYRAVDQDRTIASPAERRQRKADLLAEIASTGALTIDSRYGQPFRKLWEANHATTHAQERSAASAPELEAVTPSAPTAPKLNPAEPPGAVPEPIAHSAETTVGPPAPEAGDLFAWEDDVAAAVDADITRPRVIGGKRPRIADTPVPTRQRPRLDIEHIARAAGETQMEALQRVRRVIGRRIDATPLGEVWDRARARVVGNRLLDNASRQEMLDLYDQVRDEFWVQARADPDAMSFLAEAGFQFPATGKAPLLRVTDPPPGAVGLPSAADVPVQERRISLDHNLEKALGENYRKAIDADNLTFEFHNPNSNRETVQVKFGLRPSPGVSE